MRTSTAGTRVIRGGLASLLSIAATALLVLLAPSAAAQDETPPAPDPEPTQDPAPDPLPPGEEPPADTPAETPAEAPAETPGAEATPSPSGTDPASEAAPEEAPADAVPVEAARTPQENGTSEAEVTEAAKPPLPLRPDADQLLWRAGRDRLLGLPATRAGEREVERTSALGELAVELDAATPEGAAWHVHLTSILTSPHGSDERWCAGARAVGALRRYEHAADLLGGLDDSVSPWRREATRRALHDLYGRWFATREEATPYLEQVHPGEGTRLLLEAALAGERDARTHLLRVLHHEPAAALARLADPDPELRAGAAGIVVEAVARQALAREAAFDGLIARLEAEFDAVAFGAELEAILVLVASTPPDAPEAVRLRESLARILEGITDQRALTVARALPRVPWSTAANSAPPGILDAAQWIGRILDEVRAAESARGAPDRDAVLAVLRSLQALCDRVEGDATRLRLRRNAARGPVFEILQDLERASQVRVAAAGLLGHFALEEDAPLICVVLDGAEGTPVLSHTLLGALRSTLVHFQPESPGTAEVLARVARIAGSADPDLRRRALALLGDVKLAPLVGALDPTFLVERLGAEEVPGLRQEILRLIGGLGRPEMLAPILALPNFDSLVAGDLARVAELAGALGPLAGGRAHETVAVARRLVAVADPATRISRLQHAVSLTAALPEAAARELTVEENDHVGSWGWDLHVAGVSLDNVLPDGAAFRARMVAVHLADRPGVPVANGHAVLPEPARLHLVGLYLGGVAGAEPGPAEAAFQAALGRAIAHPDPGFANLVRRDRARIRAARGDHVRALEDYRTLAATEVLQLSDLRQAVAMIGATPASEAAVLETCDFLERLVRRPSWRSEPAGVRLEDLRRLSTSTHACAEAVRPDRLRRFIALLADLPAERPQNGEHSENPPLWFGLHRDSATFDELIALRDRAQAAIGPPEPPPAPPADPQPQETPPDPAPAAGGGEGAGTGGETPPPDPDGGGDGAPPLDGEGNNRD